MVLNRVTVNSVSFCGSSAMSGLANDWRSLMNMSSKRTSTRVVEALAAAEDVPVGELPPLYDAVDLDALDRVLETGACVESIVFTYQDYRVTVGPNDQVDVTRVDHETSPRL